MRVLVTGGAASSARTSSRRSLAAATTCGVLDACCPPPTRRARPPPLPDGESAGRHADVRDRAAVERRAARRGRGLPPGRDGRPRQGLRRRARVRRLQRPRHGGAARRAWPTPGVRQLVLAGSMVVYGEGRYDCAAPRRASGPGPRRRRPGRGPLRAALPALRRPLDARAWSPRTPRSTRATSTPPPSSPRSTWPPSWARATGGRAVVAALPQRLRPGDAPRHPVRGGRRDLPLRAGPRRGAPGLRGRRAAAGLRPRTRCRARPTRPPWTRSPAGRRGALRRVQRRQRRPAHGRRDGRRPGRAPPAARRPVVTGEYRLGDVRHITAVRAAAHRARLAAGVGFADGMRSSRRRRCVSTASTRVDPRLSRPAAADGLSEPGPASPGGRQDDLEAAAARALRDADAARRGPRRCRGRWPGRAGRRAGGVRAPVPRQPVSKTRGRSSVGDAAAAVGDREHHGPALASCARATATVPSAGVCRMALTSRFASTRVISRPSTSTGTASTPSPTSRTPCSRASGSAPAIASPTRS